MNDLLQNVFETTGNTKSGQKHLLKKLTPVHLGTRGFLAVPPELSVETSRSLCQVRETSPWGCHCLRYLLPSIGGSSGRAYSLHESMIKTNFSRQTRGSIQQWSQHRAHSFRLPFHPALLVVNNCLLLPFIVYSIQLGNNFSIRYFFCQYPDPSFVAKSAAKLIFKGHGLSYLLNPCIKKSSPGNHLLTRGPLAGAFFSILALLFFPSGEGGNTTGIRCRDAVPPRTG